MPGIPPAAMKANRSASSLTVIVAAEIAPQQAPGLARLPGRAAFQAAIDMARGHAGDPDNGSHGRARPRRQGAGGNGFCTGAKLFNCPDTSPLSRMSYGSRARISDDAGSSLPKSTQNTAGLLTGMT